MEIELVRLKWCQHNYLLLEQGDVMGQGGWVSGWIFCWGVFHSAGGEGRDVTRWGRDQVECHENAGGLGRDMLHYVRSSVGEQEQEQKH